MDDKKIKQVYKKTGAKIGYNFQDVYSRVKIEGKKWNWTDIVEKYTAPNNTLLDLGTGGGEYLIELSKNTKKSCGIDNIKAMVDRAKQNAKEKGVHNVEFKLADVSKVPYAGGCFDIVTCRHAPFSIKEVKRVLKPGGLFITQQLGNRNKLNLLKYFDSAFYSGKTTQGTLKILKSEGFEILMIDEYIAKEYFQDMEDLIFLLENTPNVPDFNRDKYQRQLQMISDKLTTPKGIAIDNHEFIIICRKT